MKKITLFLIISNLACFLLLAGGNVEISEKSTWLLSQTTVNNENYAYDMSSVQVCSASDIQADFQGTPQDNQVELFRMINTKENAVSVSISADDLAFIHESNLTSSRDFSIAVYEIKWETPNRNSSYSATLPTQVLASSSKSTDSLDFTMKKATWESYWAFEGIFLKKFFYCKTYYHYQVVIVLDSSTIPAEGSLEGGYYNVNLTADYDGKTEDILIKGYYGAEFEQNSSFSFYIQNAENTFNVDLSDTQTYSPVANLMFEGNEFVTQAYNATPPSQSTAYTNKYSIYLSPVSNYTAPSNESPSPYRFILENSEYATRSIVNTMWYGVYSSDQGAQFSKLGNSGGNQYIYKIPIPLSATVVSGTTSQVLYSCNWSLSSLPIYIKTFLQTNQDTSKMTAGNYYTTMYFFVITNT